MREAPRGGFGWLTPHRLARYPTVLERWWGVPPADVLRGRSPTLAVVKA